MDCIYKSILVNEWKRQLPFPSDIAERKTKKSIDKKLVSLNKNLSIIAPKNLLCWEDEEPAKHTCVYFSTSPQDDVDSLSDVQFKNDRVAGGVADVRSFELPGAHLVMPVLHQDGSGRVAVVAEGHEWKVVGPFHRSGEDACKRGKWQN